MTYSEYVFVSPAHRASASTIFESYRLPVPTEVECDVKMGNKGVGPWQWDTLSAFHPLPSGSCHSDKVLRQTAEGTPKLVYLNGQYSARIGNYLLACCMHTESENSMWCHCSNRKNTSARYQRLKKKDDATYHHSQWHTKWFCTSCPCRITGTDSKGGDLFRRKKIK